VLTAGAAAAPRKALPVRRDAAAPAARRDASGATLPAEDTTRALLERVTALSERIARESQTPGVWRLQVEQGELLLHLAVATEGKEREEWLRSAVDSYYSAAVQSPANDPTARELLAGLPDHLANAFKSPLHTYAALQKVHADYLHALAQAPDKPDAAALRLCEMLLAFAQAHPQAPEAPQAVLDAARHYEALNKSEDARRCYHFLAGHYADQPVGRKAAGVLWRMGGTGQPVRFALPYLYPARDGEAPFQLGEVRARLVVVYFWSAAAGPVANDLDALKALTDRYRGKGLEVIYINVDRDAAQAREFLSGRLTAGVHLHQPGGTDGEVAERYGIVAVPHAMLLDWGGALLRHSVPTAELEAEAARRLGDDR
jgi:peroxiredoxin